MKAYSVDFRKKIVETYESEKISKAKLAKRFNVAKSFVQKLLKQWRETGNLEPRRSSGGQKLKLSSSQIICVGDWVSEKNDITLKEIKKRLEEQEKVKVSLATICRILQSLNLTRKKKTLQASERNTDRVQNLRREYREKVRDIPAEDLIFVDEAASNLGMTLAYGRAEKGKRAYSSAPCNRGENVSMVAAIALKGLLALVQILGATKGIQFEAFIANVLVPLLWAGACVIMDNAKIHQEEYIRPLIEETGAKLIFLPPYSPDFSPIENCWSKIKQILKTLEPRNYCELRDAVCHALGEITLKDIHGWFTHGCYCDSPFVETNQSPVLTSVM